jgi:exopolysaccharide production protein ExoZ
MTPERGALDSVQALRALAALAVVIYHVDYIGKGAFGVDVFFVISGFIICYVTARDPAGFFAKRLIRIVPLYWVGTLTVFALALAAPRLLGATSSSPVDLLRSLFFIPYEKEPGRVVPVLFLGWTLNYEMFFYLVYAAALCTRAPALTSCLVLAGLAGLGQLVAIDSIAWRFYANPILYEFCYGMGIYWLWQRRAAQRAVPAWMAAATALAALALMVQVEVPFDASFRFMAWGVPAALAVASVLVLQSRLAFPLTLVAIGDASYSLYLFHPYVLKAVEKAFGRLDRLTAFSVAASAAYVVIAVIAALYIYRYFEKPAIKLLRQRLLAPSRRRVLAPT